MSVLWKLKQKIRKLILGCRSDSESYAQHLRDLGAKIGDRTVFFEPGKICVDETRPFLVEIGDDVQITRGVTILTHGYDWSVLKGIHGEVLGSAGRVKIGNNVFIGANTTILKGVTIGNNVIVGAASLVNKDIPDNCVYVGNPARFVCTVQEYYQKRKEAQLQEAECVYTNYVAHFGKEPDEGVFGEFFWLFQPRDKELHPEFDRRMRTVGNYKQSMEKFKASKPMFDGYEAFLQYLRNKS